MAKEFDSTTQLLVETAACDAYADLVTIPNVAGVTKFVHSGDDLIRVRVSIVQDGEDIEEGKVDTDDCSG